MLAVDKTMDVARHVLQTLFRDTKFPLIQHHLDSFNDFLTTGIPSLIRATNESAPFELELAGAGGTRRFVRVYVGGKDGSAIRYAPPMEEDGTAIVPHACRLDNRTYALSLLADLAVEYSFADGTGETRTFKDILIGKIPLMLRSKLCYLSGMEGYEIGECKYELGGYFIIDGAEKVLLTQELLGDNMVYAGTRKRKVPRGTTKRLVEEEAAMNMIDVVKDVKGEADDADVAYEETTETYVGLRSMSEDGSRGPYSHFLVLPSETSKPVADLATMQGSLGRDNRLAVITMRGFSQPIPLVSVFRALGCASDKDIYEATLVGVPDADRNLYDDVFYQILLSHDKFLAAVGKTDLEYMSFYSRSKSRFEVVQSIYEKLFSHVEGSDEDPGSLFRRKTYMLGSMLKMAMDVAIGRKPPSDRDSMPFKRFKTTGVLMFEEFRRIFRELGKNMILRMDESHTYNPNTYREKQLVEMVQPENVNYFWKGYRMLNEFSRSFKGVWNGRVGISQELMRVSYLAVIHHLRKTDLQIDKTISTAPPRRLTGSQFGTVCPIDSPDGSDIGYKKALPILARISTAFPSEDVKTVLRATGMIREIKDVHPSTWVPTWTPIYLNSDLYAVCVGNTEDFHRALVAARRGGALGASVSLSWMRIKNEYKIYSDAGRSIRPIYREGTLPEQILSAKTWDEIAAHLDYVDASEMDSLRISMTPFHPRLPSEIHMTFNLSALANMVPYSDHNPGSRSVFSIAQQKSAAGWYHTNYLKRFDTVSEFLSLPQKPLSQTWLYNEMLGRGGCLPYGENAMVAITMYGGNNQEDSVLMNRGALRRGMYQTMYSHAYEYTEEFVGMTARDRETGKVMGPHSEIANPLKHEDVKRKEGFDYEQLDANGIIKVNTIVTSKTILVGVLTPSISATGQVTGHRDSSVEPKRGQVGRVDAVYAYSTSDGLRGVKIRIVEERFPVIGDKMSSRHSQKGTIGQIMDESDMPFTADGRRPDLIFNPHGIPTRMTVGQFLEAASNKLGLKLGSFVDATPFTVSNRVRDLKQNLLANGYQPYGHEVLYNGQTGEMMEADIFMGPIYYQRLKQMVEDKINYRDTGPKKSLTKQPTQGRSDEGGMRIGEMERDGLVAHGMSRFMRESFMERSDKHTFLFDREQGRIGTSRDSLEIPYSMGLFSQELEAMHIQPYLETA
jgi:DNA-directed RNA polymerase II subunit RPB2